MFLSIAVIIIAFILEIILNNFLPFMVGNLSFFTPMFIIVSLIVIYPFFIKNKTKYFFIAGIVGFIYDLFFTNLLFYNAIIFLALSFIISLLYRYINYNYLSLILFIIISICLYEGCNALIIILFNLVPMSFNKLFYKISHSLIINIIYGEILYFIINHLPNKYKKSSIN